MVRCQAGEVRGKKACLYLLPERNVAAKIAPVFPLHRAKGTPDDHDHAVVCASDSPFALTAQILRHQQDRHERRHQRECDVRAVALRSSRAIEATISTQYSG